MATWDTREAAFGLKITSWVKDTHQRLKLLRDGTVSPGKGPRKSGGLEEKLPDVTVLVRADPGEGMKSEPCLGTFFNGNFLHERGLFIYQVLPHT